ncbi:uncharacterized protein LOC135837520 [Planococcus citri]|uniref:uncharacterized protein LOC135837520 n=1 Tax=Planococcus citri TaxID=170843 RepID=UPI0031F82FD3
MNIILSSALVFLLAAGFQIKNAVRSEDPSNTPSPTPLKDDHDDLFEVENSEETLTPSSSSNKEDESVAEMLRFIPETNTNVVKNLIKTALTENDIFEMVQQINLGPVQNLQFPDEFIESDGKTIMLKNIRAYDATKEPVETFYVLFTSSPQHSLMTFYVVPENMAFEGDYSVPMDDEDNSIFDGHFQFDQNAARLSCRIHNISSFEIDNCDLSFRNGEVKFTQLIDDGSRPEFFTPSAHKVLQKMYARLLEELNLPSMIKIYHQFVSAFPFLSICSSSPPTTSSTTNYHVIEEPITKTYKSSRLILGPMIFKGLDNFIIGDVIASKSPRQAPTTTYFSIITTSKSIQGRCDWQYFETNHQDTKNTGTFAFVIEEVELAFDSRFTDKFIVDGVVINVNEISIHRVNKTQPKIHEFTKSLLQEVILEATIDSIKKMFHVQFPEMSEEPSTTEQNISLMNTKITEPSPAVHTGPVEAHEPE